MTIRSLIKDSCMRGDVDAVKEILENNIDEILDIGNILLDISCSNGYTGIVKLLLKYDMIDTTSYGNSAFDSFSTACSLGYLEIVKILLKDGRIDPTDKNNEVIQNTNQVGHNDVVKELLNDPRVDAAYDDNLAIICE